MMIWRSSSTRDSANAYDNRGIAYENLGKHELAIADCDIAIKLDPNYADAYLDRGCAYENLGKYDLAITDCDKAIKLNPNDAIGYNNRGWAFEQQGKDELAIADYNMAIKLNPNYTTAYLNRGWAYKNQGMFDKEIADETSAIQLDPNNADAYSNRGEAYMELDKYEPAIADFDVVIKLNAKDTDAYLYRGWAYESLGKDEPAIADYDQAINIDPNDANLYAGRGWAYEHQGKPELAIADCNAAIKLDPNNAAAYNFRGISYRTHGDTARSEADLAKATALTIYGKDAPPVSRASFTSNKKSSTVNFESYGPCILVKARIGNGKKKYIFTLDTGACISVISEKLANELKLKKLGEIPAQTDALGTKFNAWPCLLDSITLGKCRVENPTCVIADLQPFESGMELKSSGITLGGILGADFLRHYRVTIDYDRQTITFSRTTDSAPWYLYPQSSRSTAADDDSAHHSDHRRWAIDQCDARHLEQQYRVTAHLNSAIGVCTGREVIE